MKRSVAASAAVLCAGLVAVAQEPAAQPKPQFRSGVEVVRLDVSVLDKSRRPIRGLVAADFIVTVDGVEQPISAVSEIHALDRRALPAGWAGEVAPDVHTNDLEHPRLFVLLLDDANVPWQPAFIDNTRKIAHAFVDRMGPNDRAAVVFTGINKYAVDFTNDRAKLKAAIEKVNRPALPACLRLSYSIRALNDVVTLLGQQPGIRASVIFISVGPPVTATMEKDQCYPGLDFMGDDGQSLVSAHMLSGSPISHVNNVRIYGISPAGLIAPGPALSGTISPVAAERGNDFLRTVADATGGKVIVNTNTPAVGVPDIIEENSTYYIVGYRPTYDQTRSAARRIKVGVKRGDVIVLPSERRIRMEPPKPAPERRSTSHGLAELIPLSGLPMRMALAAVPMAHVDPGKVKSELIVTVGAAADDLEVRVFDPEGKELAVQRAGATPVRTESVLRFTLPKGRYNVRAAARDPQSGTLGSVFGAIELADYRRQPLSLSAWISFGDADTPTAVRAFAASDAPSVVMRLRQGGDGRLRDARIQMTVLTQTGDVVHSREILAPDDEFDAARSADVRSVLPVSSLAPGSYLLRVDASLGRGSDVRHQIRFERRP